MEINFKIQDLNTFLNMLTGISKFVPGCQFNVGNEFTSIKCTNKISRAFFYTNSLTSNVDHTFYIGDISKFIKILGMIKTYEPNKNEVDISIKSSDNSNLVYDSGYINFKYKLSARDIVDRYITEDIKTSLKTVHTFKIPHTNFKMALGYFSILQNEDSKIYFTADGKHLYGEIDCKQRTKDNVIVSNNSSLKIPLCTTDQVTNDLYAMNMQSFKDMFIFDCDNTMEITQQGAVISSIEINNKDNIYIKMKMYSPLVRSFA